MKPVRGSKFYSVYGIGVFTQGYPAYLAARQLGFRLAVDSHGVKQQHRGGCFRDTPDRARWIRQFDWPNTAKDEILSFRLVHDIEEAQ
jgi:hypothetical protein